MARNVIVVALAGIMAVASNARAEQLVEDNTESRLVLAFRADAAALQKRLPPELEVSPAPGGPAKDANLVVVFYDRLHQLDGSGKPTSATTMRMAVVVAAVKTRAAGKPAFAVLRVFNPNPEQVPGFYKAGVLAEVKRETSVAASSLEPGSMSDAWEVSTKGGDTIRVRVEYARGVPSRSVRELQVFSGVQGGLFRIYRTDELGDVVRSAAGKVDRAKKLEYRFAVADMADLFGDETQLLAVSANPVFLRKVFLP